MDDIVDDDARAVVDDDGGAGPGESDGLGPTEAGCGPGHHGHPAAQVKR